jgi:hypothetical protein
VPGNMAFTPWILLVKMFELDPTLPGKLDWMKDGQVFDSKAKSPINTDYSLRISNTCPFPNAVPGQLVRLVQLSLKRDIN